MIYPDYFYHCDAYYNSIQNLIDFRVFLVRMFCIRINFLYVGSFASTPENFICWKSPLMPNEVISKLSLRKILMGPIIRLYVEIWSMPILEFLIIIHVTVKSISYFYASWWKNININNKTDFSLVSPSLLQY